MVYVYKSGQNKFHRLSVTVYFDSDVELNDVAFFGLQ